MAAAFVDAVEKLKRSLLSKAEWMRGNEENVRIVECNKHIVEMKALGPSRGCEVGNN